MYVVCVVYAVYVMYLCRAYVQQFYLPKPKTEEAKKSPHYREAKLWLKLPPNIRQMEGKEE